MDAERLLSALGSLPCGDSLVPCCESPAAAPTVRYIAAPGTMVVCTGADQVAPGSLGGLSSASTSAPYVEMQVAIAVPTAIDQLRHAAVATFGGPTRVGLAALRRADNVIRGDSLSQGLVLGVDVASAGPARYWRRSSSERSGRLDGGRLP